MDTIRRQSRVDCDIILNKFESGGINLCRATNISLSGMRLQRVLEPNLQKDTKQLRLELELPGEQEPLRLAAQKVYQDEEYFGVRFTNISHRHFIRLREWIAGQSIQNELPAFH